MKKQINKFLNNKFCEIFLVLIIIINIVCLGFEASSPFLYCPVSLYLYPSSDKFGQFKDF